MFKESEFFILPCIKTATNTPDPAPVIPTHPGAIPTSSTILTVTNYNKERELFHRYKNMIELGRQTIQNAYPEGDYLLDLRDEYGRIIQSPLQVW